jgi:peptide/nickel transport system substrate-binding protein
MVTTFRLKPNLVWHDGTAHTAEDFVFAWRVYATPDLGQAASPPLNLIEQVEAPDPRTVVVRWRRPFAQANTLGAGTGSSGGEFGPLPRHILENAFLQASRDGNYEAFVGHPFWTREFVGLGPFKLDRWEPGVYFEGVGFAQHVLGRPKIERVKFVFMPDANTALASVLAGDVHFAADDSIRLEQAFVLQGEWGPRGGGSILSKPSLWRGSFFQLRPEMANPSEVLDLRVRRAFAHAVDRQGLNDGLFEGHNILGDTIVPPSADSYAELERAMTKYPFDLRRTAQLMQEAGLTRTGSGPFSRPDGRPVTFEAKSNASTQQEQELAILASSWRNAGFDIQEAILPAAQAQDSQVRASYPAIYTFSGPQGADALARMTSSGIPRPENRWSGSNRGGWGNPEFDQSADRYLVALEPRERVQHLTQMVKLFTEEVPAISLYFNAIPIAFTATLRGLQESIPEADWSWNVHEWEFR